MFIIQESLNPMAKGIKCFTSAHLNPSSYTHKPTWQLPAVSAQSFLHWVSFHRVNYGLGTDLSHATWVFLNRTPLLMGQFIPQHSVKTASDGLLIFVSLTTHHQQILYGINMSYYFSSHVQHTQSAWFMAHKPFAGRSITSQCLLYKHGHVQLTTGSCL